MLRKRRQAITKKPVKTPQGFPRIRLSDPMTGDSGLIRFGSGCAPAALRKAK